MHETKEEFLEICLIACIVHTFINYVALPYEGKSENIAISHLIKIQHFVAKALQSQFKVETVPSRNTIIYLTEKYIGGWCVSIPQKSFSERKKQVRTAEETRLIHTHVDNVFKRNLTDTVGHRGQFGHLAPSWLEGDAGEVHHPAAEGCVPRSCSHSDHKVAAGVLRGHGSSEGHEMFKRNDKYHSIADDVPIPKM